MINIDGLILKIITPNKIIYQGEVRYIKARTTVGDVGILSNHVPYIGLINNSVVVIKDLNENKKQFICQNGIINVKNNIALIAAQTATSEQLIKNI